MSIFGYKPKTKPALWTQTRAGRIARASEAKRRAVEKFKSWASTPRKRIAPMSKRQRGRTAEYLELRAVWLKLEYPRVCEGCEPLFHRTPRLATDVHHKFGRAGKLLLDTAGFVALCAECHRHVHDNPNAARAVNLLCQPGEWNTTP